MVSHAHFCLFEKMCLCKNRRRQIHQTTKTCICCDQVVKICSDQVVNTIGALINKSLHIDPEKKNLQLDRNKSLQLDRKQLYSLIRTKSLQLDLNKHLTAWSETQALQLDRKIFTAWSQHNLYSFTQSLIKLSTSVFAQAHYL